MLHCIKSPLGIIKPKHGFATLAPRATGLFGSRVSPNALDRSAIDPDPQLFGNDQHANCTSVAIANGARAISKLVNNSSNVFVIIGIDEVMKFYQETSTYLPGFPDTDIGADPTNVISYLSKYGYPCKWWPISPLIGQFDHTNFEELRNAVYSFGVINCGVALATADQCDGLWDTTNVGNQTPGSWGYHELNIWSYTGKGDEDIVELLTFGIVKKATWRWLRSRIVFANGCAYRDLVTPQLRTVNGVLWDQFVAANRQFLSM